jgi:hypothetical protein
LATKAVPNEYSERRHEMSEIMILMTWNQLLYSFTQDRRDQSISAAWRLGSYVRVVETRQVKFSPHIAADKTNKAEQRANFRQVCKGRGKEEDVRQDE